MLLYPDTPRSVLQRERHVVTPTDQLEVLRTDPFAELQTVRPYINRSRILIDHIVTITLVVHIRVAAIAALEVIVARSADKYVVSVLTIQLVVAGAALRVWPTPAVHLATALIRWRLISPT